MVIETGQWQWTWRSGSDVRHILQIRGGGLAGGLDGTDAQNRDEVSGLRRQEECDVIFVFRLLLAAATRKSYFSMNVCFCRFPICIHLLRTDNLQLFLWSSLRLLWGDYNQIELRVRVVHVTLRLRGVQGIARSHQGAGATSRVSVSSDLDAHAHLQPGALPLHPEAALSMHLAMEEGPPCFWVISGVDVQLCSSQ